MGPGSRLHSSSLHPRPHLLRACEGGRLCSKLTVLFTVMWIPCNVLLLHLYAYIIRVPISRHIYFYKRRKQLTPPPRGASFRTSKIMMMLTWRLYLWWRCNYINYGNKSPVTKFNLHHFLCDRILMHVLNVRICSRLSSYCQACMLA